MESLSAVMTIPASKIEVWRFRNWVDKKPPLPPLRGRERHLATQELSRSGRGVGGHFARSPHHPRSNYD